MLERERTGLNVRKICKREREREREREIGVIKKIFLRICNKVLFFFGQRQIEVYLHCSGRYKR